jgi:hypothetical protein
MTCTVSAEENTPGTYLVFHLLEGKLSQLQNDLYVTYDGLEINEVTDVTSFFDNQENVEPCWLLFETPDGDKWVIVNVPHFSEHTIKISQIVEAVGGISVVIFYIVIAVVALIIFVGAGEISKRF